MMTRLFRILLLGVWICAGIGSAEAQSQADIDKGRIVVGQACIQCHSLGAIQTQRKSAEQWRDTVYSMITRGGLILPDEIEPVTAYLVASFGPNSPKPSPPREAAAGTPQGAQVQGRTILERSCIQCHDLQTTFKKAASQDEWGRIVSRMVALGAKVPQEEQLTLIRYLSNPAR
jgi:mono/diheme cytochrome c family protein